RELRLETSGVLPGGVSANVTVHNISATGLLLETGLPIESGETLAVELPQIGEVAAEVVWVSGSLVGCAFAQALSPAALAAAELRADVPLPEAVGAMPAMMPMTSETLGLKLSRLRKERSLTLAQVAEHLGVSKPTVWAWEKGKARPLPDRLDAIAEVLGVSADDLSSSAMPDDSAAVINESRLRIATALGTTPDKVRIMIEL
ncbi:MAG: helix-turn-helix domain-containing protein, partial [Pseudomonadota bacterium]